MDTAVIRYHEAVMWKKPGGNHHVKILHERTWNDKRYVKVAKDCQVGYVLAEALDYAEGVKSK